MRLRDRLGAHEACERERHVEGVLGHGVRRLLVRLDEACQARDGEVAERLALARLGEDRHVDFPEFGLRGAQAAVDARDGGGGHLLRVHDLAGARTEQFTRGELLVDLEAAAEADGLVVELGGEAELARLVAGEGHASAPPLATESTEPREPASLVSVACPALKRRPPA